MRILGIDPGLQNTGWGIIETQGSALRFIACGRIRPPVSLTLAERLASLHAGLMALMREWQPGEAAVEETFVNANPASALKLGQARGVALCAPALAGLATAEYAANKIKKSVVGAGHADKAQIALMVRRLLPGCGQVTADEADALAVAITHAHYRTQNRIIAVMGEKDRALP